jgi:hypothetical protein
VDEAMIIITTAIRNDNQRRQKRGVLRVAVVLAYSGAGIGHQHTLMLLKRRKKRSAMERRLKPLHLSSL